MTILPSLDDPNIVALLHKGAVGIIPTDTIYGLVVPASDEQAVRRLYALKERDDPYKPGTVIAASAQQLSELGVDKATVESVAHLWPNPLSIELPIGENLAYLHRNDGHRAFRVVADDHVRAFLEKTGPLLTSSVNYHGLPPATNLGEAIAYFGEEIDFYVEGGELGSRPPSTVARVKNGKVEVLRPGAVTINEKGEITHDV